MPRSYRFPRRASYNFVSLLLLGTAVGLVLGGCSEERPPVPAAVFVGTSLPRNWPAPSAAMRQGAPQIRALRFSTLDVALGSEWTGDAVASLETTRIDVKTNLFDFTMPQTAPGRFHFAMHMLDLPAFLVRPYALHVIARGPNGHQTTMVVPFRIHGRV